MPGAMLPYHHFVGRIRKLNRSSVLAQATNAAWMSYGLPSLPNVAVRGEILHLFRAWGPRVAALAAAFARPNGGRRLDPQTMLAECRHYLRIDDTLTNADARERERGAFEGALADSEVFRELALEPTLVRQTLGRTSFARHLRAQWEHRTAALERLLRGWWLIRHVNTVSNGEAACFLARKLSMEPHTFVRTGLALFSHMYISNPRAPGRLNLASGTMQDDLAKTLNIDLEVVRLAAWRLSGACEDFETWHRDYVDVLPAEYRRHAPTPLVAMPLIRVDPSFDGVESDKHQYICPSPDHFLWAVESALQSALEGDLRERLGEAVVEYVRAIATERYGADATRVLDGSIALNDPRADVIVIDGDTALIVECKKSLSGIGAKTAALPGDVVSMWERLVHAYRQCSATRAPTFWGQLGVPTSVSRVGSVVCVDDTVIAEGGMFNHFLVESGLAAKFDAEATEVVSLQQLHHVITTVGIRALVDAILRRWRDRRHGDVSGNDPVFLNDQQDCRLLDEVHDELLPGLRALIQAKQKPRTS